MGLLTTTKPWDDSTYGNNIRTLRVLVECEKGSTHKYEYDDDLGCMTIVRDLNKKYKYIYNYGCVPRTLAGDGDNLDAIVISDEPIRSGTVINTFPLLIMRMIDNGEQDDKLVCVPFYSPHGELDIKKISNYLSHYKYPNQSGTRLIGLGDSEEAQEAIEEAIRAYLNKTN